MTTQVARFRTAFAVALLALLLSACGYEERDPDAGRAGQGEMVRCAEQLPEPCRPGPKSRGLSASRSPDEAKRFGIRSARPGVVLHIGPFRLGRLLQRRDGFIATGQSSSASSATAKAVRKRAT